MPKFIYEGRAGSVVIAGKRYHPGQEIEVAEADVEKFQARPGLTLVEGKGAKAAKAEKAKAEKAEQQDALAARRALVARAKELGIPAKGNSAELAAEIEKAEATAASAGGDES